VSEFEAVEFMPSHVVRERGRASHLAVAAARLALEDAMIGRERRVDLFVGMTFPAMDYVNDLVAGFQASKKFRSEDLFLLYTSVSPNTVAMDIAEVCELSGHRFTIANACSSGALAVVEAFKNVRSSRSKICLAGGVDACLTYLAFAALIAAGFHVVSDLPPEKQSRPYDSLRSVGVASEGSCFLVIESFENAVARGAHIYGEILGASISSSSPVADASEIRQGLAGCIKRSMGQAGLSPQDISYVCAHGPSLRTFDYIETLALKDALGASAYRVPVSSIKSMIGNPMAASGPLQIAAALLAGAKDVIPPTINLEYPDPGCDLDYVPNVSRHNKVEYALVDSHGFDNVDVSIVLSTGRVLTRQCSLFC
jgi:3-oxoacyl-(acyl-carrier-protein) synthase